MKQLFAKLDTHGLKKGHFVPGDHLLFPTTVKTLGRLHQERMFHTRYIMMEALDCTGFIKGSTLVNSIKLPEMTSCWPVTNAERWWDDSYCDNLACFKNLKYKSSSTGSTWYNWPSARTWYDNDPLFNNSFVSSNHVDVVRDAP